MGWEFTDDRGITVRTAAPPTRVAAYLRAGAGLWDLGIRPVACYGSGHDGDRPDPAKSGALTRAEVPYLGAGKALDEAALSSVRPDLIVDVTYDREHAYAVDDEVAARAGTPVVALAVAGDVSLTHIVARFTALARALGAEPSGASGELTAAENAVRAAAAGAAPPRVLALSGAGPEQVHLARPATWPELRHLAGLGVRFAEPGPGGVNWTTTTWDEAAALAPGLVLADSRGNAVQPSALDGVPAWHTLTATAGVEPWNPELPCSPRAVSGFLHTVADALEVLRGKRD
ncbi:ABC transporter substrate-binding protein [Streptomyces sp. NPDC002004]